jgi:hypothetical protein
MDDLDESSVIFPLLLQALAANALRTPRGPKDKALKASSNIKRRKKHEMVE